jgi:hypothetical protein
MIFYDSIKRVIFSGAEVVGFFIFHENVLSSRM